MNVKAIMCDVDGTLLTREGKVSPVTREAIKKAREKGILFGLSTGRDAHSVRNSLKEWGIDGLVDAIVGNGGAEICDFTVNVEKSSLPLDGEAIKEIMEHFSDMDVNFAIPCGGILFAPKDDEHIRMLSKADRVPYRVVDFDEFLREPQPKVMIVCRPEYMDEVVKRSGTFHSDRYRTAALKTASVLLEYMDPGVSKTYGIRQVLELHGLTMEELCTFGDADNDYDMTVNAGVGVAMANGSEKTRGAADYITDDNNHDGIGNFINQHIL